MFDHQSIVSLLFLGHEIGCPYGFVRIFFLSLSTLSSLPQNSSQDIIFRYLVFVLRSRGTAFEKKILPLPSCFQDGCHPFLKLVTDCLQTLYSH